MGYAAHFSSEKILSSRQSGMGWTHWGHGPGAVLLPCSSAPFWTRWVSSSASPSWVTVGATPPP